MSNNIKNTEEHGAPLFKIDYHVMKSKIQNIEKYLVEKKIRNKYGVANICLDDELNVCWVDKAGNVVAQMGFIDFMESMLSEFDEANNDKGLEVVGTEYFSLAKFIKVSFPSVFINSILDTYSEMNVSPFPSMNQIPVEYS